MQLDPKSLEDFITSNPNGNSNGTPISNVPINLPEGIENSFSGVSPSMIPEDMFRTFPDIHTEKSELNKTDKQNITQTVSNVINKETIAEERVKRELDLLRHKNSPSKPRDLLKDLIMKGELRKTYKIYGYEWELRALDQGDILLAVDDIKDSTETTAGRMVSIAFSKVVYSIEKINNISIYEFFPEILPSQFKEQLDYIIACKKALRAYLLGMPQVVIDEVYEKYVELEAERDKALADLKN